MLLYLKQLWSTVLKTVAAVASVFIAVAAVASDVMAVATLACVLYQLQLWPKL